jgi:hypothetical protein
MMRECIVGGGALLLLFAEADGERERSSGALAGAGGVVSPWPVAADATGSGLARSVGTLSLSCGSAALSGDGA